MGGRTSATQRQLMPGKTFFIWLSTVLPSASRMSMSKVRLRHVGAQQLTHPLQSEGILQEWIGRGQFMSDEERAPQNPNLRIYPGSPMRQTLGPSLNSCIDSSLAGSAHPARESSSRTTRAGCLL